MGMCVPENGQDFYPGYPQGYGEFFMGQGAEGPGAINFLPPNQGTPPIMEQGMHQPGKSQRCEPLTKGRVTLPWRVS